MVDEHLHVPQTVFGDVVDKRVHVLRVLIEVRQRVLKAHEEVALLENAGTHEARQQLPLPAGASGPGAYLLPPLGAGSDVGRVYRLAPAGDIRADGHTVGGDGHGTRRIGGPADGGAPAVLADGAALAVAPQIGVDGVVQAHVQRLVLA